MIKTLGKETALGCTKRTFDTKKLRGAMAAHPNIDKLVRLHGMTPTPMVNVKQLGRGGDKD